MTNEKSDTPLTDALHKRLVQLSTGPDWIAGKDYCDMREHAKSLERRLRAAESAPVSERGTLPFKLPLRVEHIAYEGDWFRDANDEPVDADTIAKIINERLCERNK